jgi:hypothetical protein
MAHLIDPLHPLLERLGIAIRVEPWGDSAVSSLRNGVSPWGDNQLNDDAPGRCKCCFTIRSKAALRLCGGCKKARYWCVLTPGVSRHHVLTSLPGVCALSRSSPECAKENWEAHKQLCRVLAAKEQKRVKEPIRMRPFSLVISGAAPACTSYEDGACRGWPSPAWQPRLFSHL